MKYFPQRSIIRFLVYTAGITAVSHQILGAPSTNKPSSECFLGEVTNGIRCELEVVTPRHREEPVQLIVWVNHLAPTNSSTLPFDVKLDEVMRGKWHYYMATNSFCGPLELRDSTGHKVLERNRATNAASGYVGQELPLQIVMSAVNAYPSKFDWDLVRSNYFSQFKVYSGAGIFPLPLFFDSSRTEMVRLNIGNLKPHAPPNLYTRSFDLEEYFDFKVPGEYKLTVWAKVYRRSNTNDLCERIDLPPVTATFKWGGEDQR